jgi:predicted RND superfamily exporter protein
LAYTESEVLKEAPILLCLSALILFLVYFAMFRSIGYAIRLWFASLIPAVMTVAIFPIMHRPMTVYGLVAPVCALAISTAYCIHATRGLEETGGDLRALYMLKGPPIFLDYLTTFLGFSTLVPIGNPELALLGNVSNIGTTIAFIIGFFILPLTDPRVSRRGTREPLPAGTGSPASPGRASPASISPRTVALRCAASLGFALALVFLLSGWARIDLRASSSSAIFRRVPASGDAAYLEGKFGMVDEIVLHIDTGRENGLVDKRLYDAIGDFRERLAADPLVFRIYDYTDVVDSILASTEGGGAKAGNDVDIGEALELFSSSPLSSSQGMLFDTSWRKASIRIRIKPGYEGRSVLSAVARWTDIARAEGLSAGIGWSGSAIGNAIANRDMARGQLLSVIVYFAAIFVVLLLVTRSFFKSSLIVFPPIIAIFAAIGLSGILSWPLDAGSALGLAIIAGIGIDDALVFVLTKDRTDLTLKSVVEASIILILTLSSFLVSSFSLIAQVYVLIATGLVLSSASVLLVIPTLEFFHEKAFLPRKALHR